LRGTRGTSCSAWPVHTSFLPMGVAKASFFFVGGGGGADDASIAASMGRMQAWVKRVRRIVEAEFPACGVISALPAFSLASTPTDVGPGTRTKLAPGQRIWNADLVRQFTDHIAWVCVPSKKQAREVLTDMHGRQPFG
jgi:hypothetical protein